jgi:hypothetical protein
MLTLLALFACDGATVPVNNGEDLGLADNYGVEETEGDEACENLLPGQCLLPFPSDRFRDVSGERPSLVFGDALPMTGGGVRMSDDYFHSVDGYGVATPIMIQWEGATLTGLPEVYHPEQSVLEDALTVMLDTTTGDLIGHWAEWDYLTEDQDDPMLVLRPAEPLPAGHRVVVAFRGVQDETGALLPAPDGFAALRDRTASTVVGIHDRRSHFDADVFPALAAVGWARDDLQLAWDFTVATDEDAVSDLRTVRDRLLEAMGDEGPAYTIDSIQEDPDPNIAVMATGHIMVPSFLTEPDDNGLRILVRDADGLPVAGAEEPQEFTLQIPHSVWEGDGSAGVMQYGHGFVGSKSEARNGWLREMANRHEFIILATNLQGMDENTFGVWLSALPEDPGWFPWFSEEPMQGIANQLALQRMMKSTFLAEADALLARDGEPVYDPDNIWYYGNSQGGTMGTLMMTLSTDVERGVLGVPGAAYPFLLHRSTDFTDLSFVFTGLFNDSMGASILLGLLGTGFNRLDPLNFAPHIVDDPFAGTPAHQVLLHVAKEDSQVQNQVSFLLGRAVGAKLVTPAVRSVWGLEESSYPYTGGASLVEYDFGIPDDVTPMDPPPAETDTHGWLRKLEDGQDQMAVFFKTGELVDVCGGEGCFFDGEP